MPEQVHLVALLVRAAFGVKEYVAFFCSIL